MDTPIDLALRALGDCVQLKQEISERAAEVLVSDPDAFTRRVNDAEHRVGYRIECTAYSRGCLLRVTSERA